MLAKYIIIIIAVLILISCSNECNNDCPSPLELKFQIIVNDINQTSINKYSIDSVSIIGLNENEDSVIIKKYIGGEKSNIFYYFGTNLNVKKIVIKYYSMPYDTLKLAYLTKSDKCCGKIMTDYSITLGDTILCQNCINNIIRIKK